MSRRRAKNRWIALLCISLTASFLNSRAHACSWIDRPFSEWYDDADEIVIARIEAAWTEDGLFQGRQHVTYAVVERFKGIGGTTGAATATTFFLCGGGHYFPGRTYLLFIGAGNRMISDINSKLLSEDPVLREEKLQPLRDFEAGTGDGFQSPNNLEADTINAHRGTRCDGTGIRGLSNFPYYPTLRNAYGKSDIVVRAQIVGQAINGSGDVLIDARIVETYKGEPSDNRSFIASVFGTPEWMQSCLPLLNGWEYLIYANGAEGRIDERHSTALMPSIPLAELGSSADAENLLMDRARLQGLEMLRLLASE